MPLSRRGWEGGANLMRRKSGDRPARVTCSPKREMQRLSREEPHMRTFVALAAICLCFCTWLTGAQVKGRVVDLLRYLPGMAFNQSGMTGGVTSLFLRGGNSNFSLVQIDGAPVNGFGGSFDFAHIPAEALDRIEVIRGPQSAVYGPYANSGAI